MGYSMAQLSRVPDAVIDWLKTHYPGMYERQKKEALMKPVQEAIIELLDSDDVQLVTVRDTNALNDAMISTYKEASTPSKTGPARKKVKQTEGYVTVRPDTRFSDIGGLDEVIQELKKLIEWPIAHPEVYKHLGIAPQRGVLLCGPPGSGKTLLAHAVAGETGVPFFKISAPEVVSGMSGESEAKIRDLFSEAASCAPCIVFIDEIDAISPKREQASRQMDQRIVTQLMTCMDELGFSDKPVFVLAATNRPGSLDPALRRAGRFDREINLGIPDERARARILSVLTKRLTLVGPVDIDELSRCTPGYVGSDLDSLLREAATHAIDRIFDGGLGDHTLSDDDLSGLGVEMVDFEHAVKIVQPSAKREGFSTIPDVSWEDVGALENVRKELEGNIMFSVMYPDALQRLGQKAHAGVLLYGPPGCGKTLVAKALANESHVSFISVKGPELLNKYVGESERAVRVVFERARASAPCIVFFDELDALAPMRSGSESNSSSERVVNQLLTEMDGLEDRKRVFVMGATNRPDILDEAILRPGRLDKRVYVPLPNKAARTSILQALTRKTPLASDVALASIAAHDKCSGLSGADLSGVVREACLAAIRRSTTSEGVVEDVSVTQSDLITALTLTSPSVSHQAAQVHQELSKKFT